MATRSASVPVMSNAQRRRAAKERPSKGSGAPAAQIRFLDDGDLAAVNGEGGLNSMLRSNCTECGSADLAWMDSSELLDTLPDDRKGRLYEAIEMTGPGETWTCRKCGNWGLMGGWQQG